MFANTSRNNSNESHSLAQAKSVLMIASSSCSGNIYFQGFKLATEVFFS